MKNKHGVEISNIPSCEDVGCLGCGGENKTRCPCGNLSTHVALFDDGVIPKTVYFRCKDCANSTFAKLSAFYHGIQLRKYVITDEKIDKVRELLISKEAKLEQ